MTDSHFQRHALRAEIIVIAQGEQTLDLVHVCRQVGAMQLAGQIGLSVQNLIQQGIGRQRIQQGTGSVPAKQRAADKLQAE
ncbi:hypothetical protein D3C79_341680 [compost metagenome]